MAGPSLDWLQQAQAALGNGAPVPAAADPFALGAVPIGPAAPPLTGAAMPPAPGMIQMPSMPASPTPTGAPMSSPHEDPIRQMSVAPPTSSQAPPQVPTGAEPGPAPAEPSPMPPDVQFAPVGGGVMPAREMSVRGPQQAALLASSFEHPQDMAGRAQLRTGIEAAHASDVYEQIAEDAHERQAAAERVALRRQQEGQQLQADYQNTVRQLGQMHFDENRWWSKKSTGGKVESIILGVLSGLIAAGQSYGGTHDNIAMEALRREIDGDAEAQRFDYMVAKDRAQGAQNAFALAMERYGSEDAAMGATRAAALDFALAKGNQLAAQWKGTDAANQWDMFSAQLMQERDMTAAAGLRFVPAQAAPSRYKMMVRGQEIPGLVTEKEAQRISLEHGVKPAERVDDEMVKGGLQAQLKSLEIAGKRGEKASEDAKFIAKEMKESKIPQMRALTQAAMDALNESEGGKLEAAARTLLGPVTADTVMSDKANAREQAFQAFANLNMNQLSGGAISPSEETRLKTQLGSSRDPAARRRALMSVMSRLDAEETNIRAGVQSTEEYDKRSGQRAPAGAAKTLQFHGK